jgi:hypothetical protein
MAVICHLIDLPARRSVIDRALDAALHGELCPTVATVLADVVLVAVLGLYADYGDALTAEIMLCGATDDESIRTAFTVKRLIASPSDCAVQILRPG